MIGSPLSGKYFLRGVESDIENMYRYTTSSIGGGHLDGEIIYLENPTILDVRYALGSLANSDIATIYFSGHGCRANSKDYIWLNHKEYFPVKALVTTAKRHLIFIDSCRTPMDSFIGDIMSGVGFHFSTEYLELSRKLHCQYINNAPLGGAIVFATSENEPSFDTESGGVYTKSLMTTLDNWSNKHKEKMITVGKAFRSSSIITQRREPTQLPKLYGLRMHAGFNIPIGINPKAHIIQKRQNDVTREELLRLLGYRY